MAVLGPWFGVVYNQKFYSSMVKKSTTSCFKFQSLRLSV
jgi:hypothetical protein